MKWFYNMKVGTKLISGFLLVALITAAVGVVGWWGLREVGSVRMPGINALLHIEAYAIQQVRYQNLLLEPHITYQQRQDMYKNIEYYQSNLDYYVDAFLALPWTAEEERLWGRIDTAFNSWMTGYDDFLTLARQGDALGIEAPEGLQYQIAARQRDHNEWIWLLAEAIELQQPFTGGLDGGTCALGAWLGAYQTRSPQLRALMQEIAVPHNAVHAAGNTINNLLTGNAPDRQAQARTIYRTQALPAMQQTLAILDRMYDLAFESDAVFDAMRDQALLVNAPLQTEYIDLMEELVDMNIELGDAAVARSTVMILAFTVVGLALAMGLGFLISNMIRKPITAIVAASTRIADGDLDVLIDLNSKDELGDLAKAFNRMTDNVNEAMTNIDSSSEQVAAGSQQVSSASQELSQGATEQASSIEEVTASMEQLSAQTKQNADNASQANNISGEARGLAERGNRQMQDMLGAMDEINQSSSSISKIIKVIDEIAFQTNILALNAAVEAARAGQHGKGFAVVAEEVRNLAARSANAARETTDMIENSIRKVQDGTTMANDTAQALASIVESVGKAAGLVETIAVASNEQAAGINQINQAIMQISDVVQTNSATAEEAAAASEELSSQAEMLKEMVGKFKLKKIQSAKYNFDQLNPEVLRMMEGASHKAPALNEGRKQVAAGKKKIDLGK